MRLKTSKSKNAILYYVIKDYTDLDGKRTTKIFEKLGNQQQVEERFGKENTLIKIKEYVTSLNNEDKEEIIKKNSTLTKELLLVLKENLMLVTYS